ncbi:interferon-activable protein 203-like [Peromyscus eremicus]|uniref:interferon-activable protein 203-like n=1 Tax=Peromyscus eremicus TaxID=42410 RepID=UPI0027DE9C94|nr:interferon-activable protein 203-like [Peromyscus eremicus]
MSEYKTIVLQQGLEDVAVDDYQFKKIKSLLRKELNLTKKMQDDYDRIQMADLLEDTFPEDAGLDKLIEVCQSIKGLEDLAQRLKTEKAKVKKQKKGKNKTAVKKRKQEEPSSSQSLSTDNESDKSKPSAQKKRKQTTKTEGGKKMKLTQEQTQFLEPSGSNTQKDECYLQTPHKPPPTPSSSSSNKAESRSVCTTQGPQGVSYGTGQSLPCPRVKASRRVYALQMPSATASESLLAPCGPLPTASSSLLDPRVSPAMAFSALQAPLVPPPTAISSTSWTLKKGNLPKEPSKVEGHHRDPIEVMVLKVTEPFTYDLIDDKRMFHATVATETEFFRVKVFDTDLKNKFIPQKIIAISDYFGVSGFLEIYRASCVSDVNVNRTMVISNTLRRRANGTPKIKDLFSQIKGTHVNGEFVVTMKNERGNFIYYGIEDDTGKMEVVVYGRLTSIKCEPGNKLRLVCFQLTSREDTWQLKSVRHSYMQVISAKGEALNPDSVMKTCLEQYF